MKAKYFFQLVALSALWGASFMLTRIAAPALGPNLAAALRMLLATVMLSLIMWKLKTPWPWRHWKELILLGLLAVAGPHTLYARSSLQLPAGYGSLLTVTSVMFGAFASALMKEEHLTAPKVLGSLLGLAGAALLVRLGPVEPTLPLVVAAITCMAGAAISGISTPFLKRAIARMEPLQITAGMHATAVLLMVPGAVYDLPRAHFEWHALAAVAVTGIVTSGLAYWMYMRIMRHVPPMAALSSTFMSTGFGVLWAVLLLSEPTGLAMAMGGALILLACLLVMGLNPLQWRLQGLLEKL
ncbi:DMT family transporter [Rhodoferax sp. GW822-FHT02A01]|uniref:DMT family transporter n=1 Tax=Rhodoferax sp. GW822-FHT02A01 TaxID=3141537 RepID=UPI00315D6D64